MRPCSPRPGISRRHLGTLAAAAAVTAASGLAPAASAGPAPQPPATPPPAAPLQPDRPIRILAYGASNTWGYLPVDPVERRLRRLPGAQAWPGVCQRVLGPRFEVLTDALPGRTLAADRPDMASALLGAEAFNGMSELPEALVRNIPLNAVVVQLGSNDLLSDKALSPEDLVARMVAMAGLITAFRFPRPLEGMADPLLAIFVSPPAFSAQPNNPAWQSDEARRAAVTPLLRAAGARHGFAVVDGAEAVPVPGADGLHFGADAHERLGRLVAAELSRLFAAQPVTP